MNVIEDKIIFVESIYDYKGKVGIAELRDIYGSISLYSWVCISKIGIIDENGRCVDLIKLIEDCIKNDKSETLINNMKDNLLSFNGTIIESVKLQTIVLCRDEIAQKDLAHNRILSYDPKSNGFHFTLVKMNI